MFKALQAFDSFTEPFSSKWDVNLCDVTSGGVRHVIKCSKNKMQCQGPTLNQDSGYELPVGFFFFFYILSRDSQRLKSPHINYGEMIE